VHRFQHLYVWLIYCVYPLGWWFIDDFHRLATGRIGANRFSRPRRGEVLALLAGKAVFLGWALVLPLIVHRSWVVVPFALLSTATLGVTLAVVFQLAHCVGEAEFHEPGRDTTPSDWAVHQVSTTVDFARHNRLLGWYLGGLNFQVEHHLFPKVCHVHYRALSEIVEETCATHGVRYRAQPTFRAAIVANMRWLRQMGQPTRVGQAHRSRARVAAEAP
jgi:linoleoyl-CoA desaturase